MPYGFSVASPPDDFHAPVRRPAPRLRHKPRLPRLSLPDRFGGAAPAVLIGEIVAHLAPGHASPDGRRPDFVAVILVSFHGCKRPPFSFALRRRGHADGDLGEIQKSESKPAGQGKPLSGARKSKQKGTQAKNMLGKVVFNPVQHISFT